MCNCVPGEVIPVAHCSAANPVDICGRYNYTAICTPMCILY